MKGMMRAVALVMAAAGVFPAPPAGAGSAAPIELRLVKDLNTAIGSDGSEPGGFRTAGDHVYFTAFTPATGRELFRTDGTPGGLQLVRDLAPGGASSFARLLGAIGSSLVVAADDDANLTAQVWAVSDDGTSADLLASHVYGDAPPAYFQPLATIAGKVVFALAGGPPLWASDGTPGGTIDVSGTLGAATQIVADRVCALDTVAIVPLIDAAGQRRLVASDGTLAGTQSIATLDPAHRFDEIHAVRSGSDCYFLFARLRDGVSGWELWRSDGSLARTGRIAGEEGDWPIGIGQAGGLVHVALSNGRNYRLLRQRPNIQVFDEIVNVANGDGWSRLASAGGVLGYAAPFADGGGWRTGYYLTDGTTAGTRRVYASPYASPTPPRATILALNGGFIFRGDGERYVDAVTGAVSAAPAWQTALLEQGARLGPYLIGRGYDDAGDEVWRSDGTAAGTVRLHDVWATTSNGIALGSAPIESAVAGERVYFAGADELFNISEMRAPLWTTDGTGAGTRRLVNGIVEDGGARSIVPVAGGVLFQNEVYIGGKVRVYHADETLSQATPLSSPVWSHGRLLPVAGGAVFGCSIDGAIDLCRADANGTPVGTVVSNIANGRRVVPVGTIGEVAIFLADRDGDVWRSDGTAPGTFRLAAANRTEEFDDIAPASAAFGGKLYFLWCRVPGDCSLTATDGTVAGTAAVAPLPVDTIVGFATVGDRLVFATYTSGVVALWNTDGIGVQPLWSQNGTYVSDIARVGDRAHVLFGCGVDCPASYVITDGTPAGTRLVAWPADAPLPASDFMAALGGDIAVYSCREPATGVELCAVDREGEGVRLLADLMPGPASSRPLLIAATSDALYVAVDDGVHGREPWLLRWRGDAIFANGFE